MPSLFSHLVSQVNQLGEGVNTSIIFDEVSIARLRGAIYTRSGFFSTHPHRTF